jgi:hypothetical protein
VACFKAVARSMTFEVPLGLDYPCRSRIALNMANVLSRSDRAAVVSALVEGCSIRSTSRMTGVARNTVSKLLLALAAAKVPTISAGTFFCFA